MTHDPDVMQAVSSILGEVRRAKSDAKASMRAEVGLVSVSGDPLLLEAARLAEADLLAAGRASAIEYTEGEFAVSTALVG